MADRPSPEEISVWQKRLASQANNRAWDLSEKPRRSSDEDDEMLQAAHAAMYFWNIVGTLNNRAHAAQLVAHVCALLKLPEAAKHYLSQSQSFFLDGEGAPLDKAFAHAIAANVAASAGDTKLHSEHYRKARELLNDLPDSRDRETLRATIDVIPVPISQ